MGIIVNVFGKTSVDETINNNTTNEGSNTMKTAFEIAMQKYTPAPVAPEHTAMLTELNELEAMMTVIKYKSHAIRMALGLSPNVSLGGDPLPPVEKPFIENQPFFKPSNEKTKFYRDEDLVIDLSKPRTKPSRVKATIESSDDFEPVSTVKATTAKPVTSTQPKAGKEAWRTTFRAAVLEVFQQTKPGTSVKAHTVNSDEPDNKKFWVYFELHHLGSTILLKRLAPEKKAYKAFEVEIPVNNGRINTELIPAYSNELEK